MRLMRYNFCMKKQDIISILITFCVGFAAGVYVYVSEFAATITGLAIPDAEKVQEFTLVGELYGNCVGGCPSFQISYDGSYRYFYTPAEPLGAGEVLRRGKLPILLNGDLRQAMVVSQLKKQSREIFVNNCVSDNGGIDASYEITIEGNKYVLDSCGTAVDMDGELWNVLIEVWKELAKG